MTSSFLPVLKYLERIVCLLCASFQEFVGHYYSVNCIAYLQKSNYLSTQVNFRKVIWVQSNEVSVKEQIVELIDSYLACVRVKSLKRIITIHNEWHLVPYDIKILKIVYLQSSH